MELEKGKIADRKGTVKAVWQKKKREWHKKKKISSTSLWCMLLFPILILIIAITMTRMTKIENGVSC
jgi:hypothetical protein